MDFELVIASWGKRGVNFFLSTLWVDFIYAFSYTILLFSATAYFSKLVPGGIKGAYVFNKKYLCFPIIAGTFDWIENIIYIFILHERIFSQGLIFSAFVASMIKWFFFLLSFVILIKNFKAFRGK